MKLLINILAVVSELIDAAAAGEDNESNFSLTEYRQFIGFLQQPIPPLAKCHLPIRVVLDPLYLYLPSPHFTTVPLNYQETA